MTDGLFSSLFSKATADAPALTWLGVPESRTWSYGELEDHAGRWANVLKAKGAQPGERILVQVEKQAEAVHLYLGCLRTGATYVPLNTAYTGDELAFFQDDARPVLTITEADLPALKETASAASPDFSDTPALAPHPAAMLYSSGTTGRPKGVELSTAALRNNALALKQVWGVSHEDTLLHALPLFHTHGLFVALNTLVSAGGHIRMLPRFDAAAVLRALPTATLFMGVPTFYGRLIAEGGLDAAATASIRHFVSGSAPLTQEVFEVFEARTGHRIIERYGMTEAGIITAVRPGKAAAAGVVGQPLDGVDLRISEPDESGIGDVEIRSPGLFSSYWNLPDKTAEEFTADGWFKTGDLGQLDDNTGLTITGRAKDLIISGGYNVYPKEIEQVIDALAGVDECAVVGMPHPDFGEAGLAVIVGSDFDPDALKRALKAQLANYKVPKLVVHTDALPRNAMGKVQKAELRTRYADTWDAEFAR